MKVHFLLRWRVHGDRKASAKKGGYHLYTVIGRIDRAAVVERVAWPGRWAVHCIGLQNNFCAPLD